MADDFWVWRGGALGSTLYLEEKAGGTIHPRMVSTVPVVELSFSIPSKGGGETTVHVGISAAHFKKLESAMQAVLEMQSVIEENHLGKMHVASERLREWQFRQS